MAIDVYLSIDGLKGESSDVAHQGWMECVSVEWGVTQPRSATASTGGGHTAERAEFEELTFLKHADLASPILMQHCCMGKTLPSAKLEFMRADGQGDRVKYFEVELRNVLIGHVLAVIQPGDILTESVGLKFAQIKWRYTQQKISGGASGSTVGSWNLSTNRIE
jgi:type VI secretion system secreted protein Hcp